MYLKLKRFKKIKLSIIIITLLFSCTTSNEKQETTALFEKISGDFSNIHFKNNIPVNQTINAIVYEYVYNGGGVAVGDVNNDGLEDLYFTSNLESNALYLNQGNFKFKNITGTSNTKGNKGWATGVSMIDINNDGLLDIYICKSGPSGIAEMLANELYINNGVNANGTLLFTESAKEYGINDASNSIQAAFLDFDLDGDLDLFLMNHNPKPFATSGTDLFSPIGDKFYVNENGKFVNKTKEVGIYSNAISYGLGIAVGDLNNDGYPDVYVSNDYEEPDYMYINQKNGSFKELIKETTNHISNFSMGNDIADFDNDGYNDVLVLDMVSEDNYGMKTSMASMHPEKFKQHLKAGKHYQYMYNTLQKHSTHINNDGVPSFSEVGQLAGISNTDWSWAPLFADFDNDGYKDIFITNGIKKDFRNKDFFKEMEIYTKKNPDALTNTEKLNYMLNKMPNRATKNYFYQNKGGVAFENMSTKWFPNIYKTCSNGAAYADLDNDGDLDLIVNNIDQEALLLKNNAETLKNNFLDIQFTGMQNNTKGIGAKVMVYTKNEKQYFENYSVRGYQSSVPAKVHIGLGSYKKIDSLHVVWPDEKFQKLVDIELNSLLTIYYKEAYPKNELPKKVEKPIFTAYKKAPKIKHIENEYDDYKTQVLLPHKMSQFGPALAVGDINNDGLDDFYFGQSTGNSSVIYVQNTRGEFSKEQIFVKDAIYEDVDAQFFDFDNDGDLDLYVASGGNEFESNSANYADRLYENKEGEFVKRNDLLPKNFNNSSSRIQIADYNKDGYLDVFIGGRHVPHQYPAPATSTLLKNNKGQFENVTNKIAPALNEIGLVTDASWTDFDNDNDLDLLVVGAWMRPTFLENKDNHFTKLELNKKDSLSGWYFSIKAVDIDKDGDDDYILGNLGENYKYKASKIAPFEIFYDDFDENGKKDIVLGYHNFGKLFPVRGKVCSSEQIPNITKITPTYDAFGKATVKDIYGEYKLGKALHLSCYNYKSGILRNNGNSDFSFIEFPEMAQVSSINNILVKDVNKDGFLDLILSGNLYSSEIETPRNDASYGVFLQNDKQGNFIAVPSHKSGLFVKGDAKNSGFINIANKEQVMLFAKNNMPLQWLGISNK